MTSDIKKIHEKVLTFLLRWRTKNPDFRFAFRISDQGKYLSKGYWFDGNEEEVYLSFWTGMDFPMRTPNISFVIDAYTGETRLTFSAFDSLEKRKLIDTYFREEPFDFSPSNGEPQIYQVFMGSSDDYIDSLRIFLLTLKLKIDDILQSNKKQFETKQNKRNRIGFITEKGFEENYKKVQEYRKKTGNDVIRYPISSLNIKNFGPIRNLSLNKIPENCQWIFLTGENGAGKTTLLKAIATAIVAGNIREIKSELPGSKFVITLAVNTTGKRKQIIKKGGATSLFSALKIHTKGFVAIGPSRLNVNDASKQAFKGFLHKGLFNKPWLQLFVTDGLLVDIGTVYASKLTVSQNLSREEEKIRYIIRAITSICETIVDLDFGRNIKYYEVDGEGKPLKESGVPFKLLASGYKSIIAMVSHIMLHLYSQQPEIYDPSELEGVVVIDEIDLHFHPKMQRDLVIKLTELFPRIQFIASTHSPIPLLGAPAGSVIFKVARNAKKGVYAERMDGQVPFENLLPNSILTSPIFGLNDITSESHKSTELVRFEDSFNQVEFNRKLEKEIDEFMTSAKEKELKTLFNK